ncbi:MAG TPA: hypothetical protein VLS85_01885 [Hanamia sp.]|nr:hypothetical protein [Hanamia sp.]
MKNFLKLFLVVLGFLTILSGCSGSKYASGAQHNRGVNNSHYRGY